MRYVTCKSVIKNPLAKQCLAQLSPLVPPQVIQGLRQQLSNKLSNK